MRIKCESTPRRRPRVTPSAPRPARALQVHDAVEATKGGVNDGIIAFLRDWLVTHIKGSDMGYKGVI